MRVIYIVAPDHEAYLRWIGRQDPSGGDPTAEYRFWKPEVGIRGKRPRFLFLKGWQTRPDWRHAYNRALAQGRRWWE